MIKFITRFFNNESSATTNTSDYSHLAEALYEALDKQDRAIAALKNSLIHMRSREVDLEGELDGLELLLADDGTAERNDELEHDLRYYKQLAADRKDKFNEVMEDLGRARAKVRTLEGVTPTA